jgi:polyphosphate kinase
MMQVTTRGFSPVLTTSRNNSYFNGRDYSWMQFNRRVLEEAEDPANPLLERVKFLAITGQPGRIR